MSTTMAQRRSAGLEELIDRDAAAFRILTGDRPTGRLHLGHYFGTLRNRVRLQNLGAEVFVLIADYQVLTDRDTAEHLEEYVTGLLLDYLAIGLDPARTVIFAHSAVPALNQLLLLGTDGTKVSKSRGNTIPLSATADETARLIRGAQTDSERHISYDPAGRPAVFSLVLLAALCLDRDPREVAADIGGGAAALKDVFTTAVNDLLAPVRARRAGYARDLGYVRRVLRDGNARANEIATVTLAEVQAAMGMRY
jgi:tryptophanyl-tRNA synthetase